MECSSEPRDGADAAVRIRGDACRLVAALDAEAAAHYLGMKDGRWMDDAPIPWVDLRKPGSTKPLRRWRIMDLDAFLARRLVQPGQASPFE